MPSGNSNSAFMCEGVSKKAVISIGLMITVGLTGFVLPSCARSRPHRVYLHWHPPVPQQGVKVVSYNVYRSETSGEGYVRIKSGVHQTIYMDMHVKSDKTYFYVVTAVDEHGHESKHSNEIKATIPAADR